jgi:hypothetical protein
MALVDPLPVGSGERTIPRIFVIPDVVPDGNVW